jgi:hypothetical protein
VIVSAVPSAGREPGRLDPAYLETVFERLRFGHGIGAAPGLTAQEILDAESLHGFRFPPDLRSLLEFALPLGDSLPNWREPGSEAIRSRLDWPAEGMCFDIEHTDFWLPGWGQKPATLADAFRVAREAVGAAPFLIPVYSHRYLPASPHAAGNPVFSVHQTDIIRYGNDLPSYLTNEFGVHNPYPVPSSPRPVAFWDKVIAWWETPD